MVATPAGWTLVGTRLSSTDTETILYSKVAAANDAGRSQAVDFTATTKATLTLLAYDGTDDSAAGPIAAFASAAETTNRATHTTPGANVATAGSYVVSYWADKSSATTGWTLPGRPDPAQHLARHRPRTHHLGRLRPERGCAGRRLARAAPPPPTPRRARRRCGPSCSRPDPDANPNVAPVASFTTSCPTATCTVDALGLHRHRARHRGVVRLGLRRRRHGHRCVHDPHLHDQRQPRRSR